jgi:ElaB/YqjD/DUF883 family membrane-anchored ribosome-binding protein
MKNSETACQAFKACAAELRRRTAAIQYDNYQKKKPMNQQDFEQTMPPASNDRSASGEKVWNENQRDPASAEPSVRERLESRWASSKERAADALQRGGEYVRENPVPVLATALVFGFALGLLAGPRRHKSWQERHVTEPLEHSGGALLGAALATAAICKRLFRSATSAARATGESVSSESGRFAKAARRAGRRLHIS